MMLFTLIDIRRKGAERGIWRLGLHQKNKLSLKPVQEYSNQLKNTKYKYLETRNEISWKIWKI